VQQKFLSLFLVAVFAFYLMPYTSMTTPSQESLETENVVFESLIQPSWNYTQEHITSAAISENGTEDLDDGINKGLWIASCCFGMLTALLMCYLCWHYFTTKQFRWAIIVNIVVLIITIFSWSSLLELSYNEDHAFQCPDGTIVTYGDSRDARGNATLGSLEEFYENPPPEWCDESLVWLEELTDQYFVFFIALLTGIFVIPNALLVYVQKSTSPLSVGISQPKNILSPTAPWYKSKNVWFGGLIISLIIFALLPIGPIESDVDKIPGSSFMMNWGCDEGESITECRTDEDGYVRDSTEEYRISLLAHFGAGITSCIIAAIIFNIDEDNGWVILFSGLFALGAIYLAFLWLYGTIALSFSEIFAGNIPYILNLSLVITSLIGIFKSYNAPPLNTLGVGISTNSNSQDKTMAGGKGKIDHEQIKRLVRQYSENNVVLKNYIHNSLPEPKESSLMNAIIHRRSEHQKKQQSKPKSLREQGSIPSLEPASKDTDFLNNQGRGENPKSSNPIISEDSQGVITRTTSFSVVRIDKIAQLVEKTPTKDDFNQMFIDEITTMKALDGKNIEVGLIDYELGDSPKIITRYFGSHNLGDVVATANNRGKKILISELIKKVSAIHGAGWVHRDLKPDNIMVDRRPKGDHRLAEIIDYGIAMKVNRKQTKIHNTAGTAFFGHNSQKDNTFHASTGQDWFSLARIFALILRGVTIESLDAEIQMSRLGLDLSKEIRGLEFDEKVAFSLQELITQATKPNCSQDEAIVILSRTGKELYNALH
tara:strand:+ start:167 stop:2473 length:2307 start_codon:yes stop_codon:yes gene_type:complete